MALSSVELAYIARVAGALSQGADLGSNARAAGQNYCKLQDIVAILDILQSSMTPTGVVTVASNGTTTTTIVTAVPVNAYIGATLTFAANTTTVALRGATCTVKSNTATTFTTSLLPAATAATDTFTISGGPMASVLTELKGSRLRSDNVPAGIYGDNRLIMDVLNRLLQSLAGSSTPTRTLSRSGAVTAAGSTDTILNTTDTYRPDEFKGKRIVIAAQTRTIVSNGANFLVLNKVLSAAPAAGVAYTVSHDYLDVSHLGKQAVHPGGHAENMVLGSILTQLSTLVHAFVLPT